MNNMKKDPKRELCINTGQSPCDVTNVTNVTLTDKRCEYCGLDTGQIEWHHPISSHPEIGLYLCQPCHSLIQGRKKLYTFELNIDLDEKRKAIWDLIYAKVRQAGYNPKFDIDKK